MPQHRLSAGGRQITIDDEPGKARLFLDDEEIGVHDHDGEPPFSSPDLPGIHFDSLENLAKALIQHRFPGGDQ